MENQQDFVPAQGVVSEALPNETFRVLLDGTGHTALCRISGKMRMYHIRVLVGDRVDVELSVYDLAKGRITRRLSLEKPHESKTVS